MNAQAVQDADTDESPSKTHQQERLPVPLTLTKAVGLEMRQEREARGLTRAQLVAILPSGIGDKTLLTYEHGIRSITVERLEEICEALGTSSSALLERARKRRNADNLENIALLIDVTTIGKVTRNDRFAPIHLWAHNTRDENPDAIHVELEPKVVREFAVLMGVTHRNLAEYLSKYTPKLENE